MNKIHNLSFEETMLLFEMLYDANDICYEEDIESIKSNEWRLYHLDESDIGNIISQENWDGDYKYFPILLEIKDNESDDWSEYDCLALSFYNMFIEERGKKK